MAVLHLHPRRERSVLRRHPWVFAGAVARVEGDPAPGAPVEVRSSRGDLLGMASYAPASQIRARMWTFGEATPLDEALVRARLASAWARRDRLGLPEPGGGCRRVFGEADGLPGLIVDQLADGLVTQFLGVGAEHWRSVILDTLQSLAPEAWVFERSEGAGRAREGLSDRSGALVGTPPEGGVVREGGLSFEADIVGGHKTGWYLDQREHRLQMGGMVGGKEVLDAFAYTGGFTAHALAGGAARVTSVENSGGALAGLGRNLERNQLDSSRSEVMEGDAFHVLRGFRDRARTFDLIVLDPPKFAETRGQVEGACRGYKDINLLAFKLLRPGGRLVTFSCSGVMAPDLFQKVVADAAIDAGRDARLLHRWFQPPDHPVPLTFPEALYLKGLVLEVE